jgi:hypothetical protein
MSQKEKHMKNILRLVLLVLLYETSGAQTLEQRIWLERFAEERAARWAKERTEAESLAIKLGLPIRKEYLDGSVIELQRLENGRPLYYETHNLNAAKTISSNRVWPGGTGGYSLTGASPDTLGIWDGGAVRTTHEELMGRAIQKDGASTSIDHATHVAGTMIASGITANAKGMSYQGRLNAYDWDNDQSEMASAGLAGLRTSNHSYGFITGWRYNYFDDSRWAWFGDTTISNTQDYYFGFYDSEAQAWDNIARNTQTYLIVKSAGNDRGEGPLSQPVQHWVYINGEWALRTTIRNRDGGTTGYDCISHSGVAKNILTVGAVDDIPNGYTQPSDVVMSTFSSWGPTDDGRIKPDLVANGVLLYSPIATSNTSYGTLSGTSMASPNVAGSVGLLLQHHRNLWGSTALLSSTLKALLIHTTDEAGPNPGPDYQNGWGLMNTLRAAQVMSANAESGGNRHIRQLTLNQGQTIDLTVASDGSQPLRTTICWNDPAGTPPPTSLNPATIMLVNDLDLRIIQGSTTYQPWILDRANPSNPATTGDNIRDNVEQVHVASPPAGTYTVRISHKGTLVGFQVVSVITTGAIFDEIITVASPNGGEAWPYGSNQTIQWTSYLVSGNMRIELSRDGGSIFSETLFSNTANDGSESWTVTEPISSTARVKISSVSTPGIADTSDANFTIFRPTLAVADPNGGETWVVGTTQTIQWTTNIGGSVRIELSRTGGVTYETLIDSTANDGSEDWTVTGAVTSAARIRIRSRDITTVSDVSNANFAIVQPTVTIVSPNGGETWAIGSVKTIQWTSSYVTGNVCIELSRNGGSTFSETLFSNTANDGSENWGVTGPVTSAARIRVRSLDIPTLSDTSNANFTIVQPTLTVLVPNGGETWAIGSSWTIQWNSSNVTGNVEIRLSRDGGTTYEMLFASTVNDGSETWTVTGADGGTTGTYTARIRIRSLDIQNLIDVSDGNFTIIQPFLTVLAPIGGETWVIGTNQTIQWTSSNVSGDMRIELSRNGGSTFSDTLFALTSNDGSETWTVSGSPTTAAMIRISSIDIPSLNDTSDGNFTTVSNVVTSTPTGGNWSAGSTWVGEVAPTSADVVIIADGATVTLDGNISRDAATTLTVSGRLNLGTDTVSGAGSLTLASGGTLGIGSPSGIASSGSTGNIQVLGSRSFSKSANYVYNGVAAQVTGNGLPDSVNSLRIDNSSGVTLNANLTISATLLLTNGVLQIASIRTLTMGPSASIAPFGTGRIEGTVAKRTNSSTTGIVRLMSQDTYMIIETAGITAMTIRSYPGQGIPELPQGADTTRAVRIRYYQISSVRGTGVATLRLDYLPSEQGSNYENAAGSLWKKVALGNPTLYPWIDQAASTSGSYFVEKAAIDVSTLHGLYSMAEPTAALPIQLASFTAQPNPNGSGVLLEWMTITEVNNYGFYVQKYNESTDLFETIESSFQRGADYTLEPQSYFWIDENITDKSIQYRLKQVDNDGLEHYFGPIMLNPTVINESELVPFAFTLNQNYPNPFNPSTKISFSLANSGYTTLMVYNLLGQAVATLFSRMADAGRMYVVDFDASSLGNGIYFYRLQAGNFIETKKLVLLR